MHSRLHQFLATFMALWMPFCCCQVRAAAAAVVHAGQGTSVSEQAEDSKLPPCCRAKAARGKPQAVSAHPATSSCCDEDGAAQDTAKDNGHGKSKGSCCTSCKERVLPPAPVTIDHDAVGTIDFVATAVLAEGTLGLARPAAAPLARRDTGPPRAPAGRQALALHSTLVI
jgi:hypothetical protein